MPCVGVGEDPNQLPAILAQTIQPFVEIVAQVHFLYAVEFRATIDDGWHLRLADVLHDKSAVCPLHWYSSFLSDRSMPPPRACSTAARKCSFDFTPPTIQSYGLRRLTMTRNLRLGIRVNPKNCTFKPLNVTLTTSHPCAAKAFSWASNASDETSRVMYSHCSI